MEHLRTHAQTFGEGVCTHRHDHELLNVDRIVRVRTAIDDVHHGNRHQVGIHTTDVPVEWLTQRACSRFGHRHAHSEQSIGAQVSFVIGAVKVNQVMVDAHLIKDVHAHQLFCDDAIDVFDGLQDAFTQVAVLLSVSKLNSLVDACTRPRRDSCAAENAFSCDDFNLYGWISTRIQNLSGVNVIDVLHDQTVCCGVCC